MDDLGNCAGCNRPLIEIDHYGERLIGCVRCNRWGWQPDKPFFMELPEEDIRAIREAARRGGWRRPKPTLLFDGSSDQLDSSIKPPQGVLCVF
jgi:hypothetical protein